MSGPGNEDSRPPQELTRREFTDYLLGGAMGLTALAALYPTLAYLVPPETGEAEVSSTVLPFTAEELRPNSGRIFKFGSKPGIVLKTLAGEVRAFSARCTHLSCIVEYAEKESMILCNCHSGWYDLTGKNVAGPPPRPLQAFKVNLRRRKGGDGHEIVVSRG